MSNLQDLVSTLLRVLQIIFDSILNLVRSPPKKSVRGDVALVTGGASGLGRLLSIELAKQGCEIVLWDINENGLHSVSNEIESLGAQRPHIYVVDLSNKEDIYAVARQVKKDVGQVDILVNNAGIVSGKKFLDCSDEMILKTFQVNTISHFWTAKAFLPDMINRNHGHIVTVASSAGLVGVKGLADYCASKFAAFGFDESLRQELRSTSVKTTCVCPYYINTGMFDGVQSKFGFLPMLEPDYVVARIVDAILTDKEVLVLPLICYLSVLLRGLLPAKALDEISDFLGVSQSMDQFKGRNK